MARLRAFAFTVNNYDDGDIATISKLTAIARYLIVGDEKGDSGTPHLQGYIYTPEAKTFSAMKKKLPAGAHIEAARGSPEQNQKYCSKQKVLIEHGDLPYHGKRTDIEQVREILNDPQTIGPMRTITSVASSLQSIRIAEIFLKYNEPGRSWRPDVHWYWGPSGSGKTYQAKAWLSEDNGDVYKCMKSNKWWEGYDAQPNILIDEFRKNWCLFAELLDLLDENEYRVECKGGSRQLLSRKIAITSCFHPEDVYDTREDVYQLTRRITQEGKYPERIIGVGDAKREKYLFSPLIVPTVS